MVALGFSSNRLLNLRYTSTNFGGQKLFGMWSLYFDVLYSVNSNIYTGQYGNNNEEIIEKVDKSNLDIHPFGLRFGGYRKVSMVRWNLATIYSFEVGSLPGAVREVYFTIGAGLVFGSFKKP